MSRVTWLHTLRRVRGERATGMPGSRTPRTGARSSATPATRTSCSATQGAPRWAVSRARSTVESAGRHTTAAVWTTVLLTALVLLATGCQGSPGLSPFETTGPDGIPLTVASVTAALREGGFEVRSEEAIWNDVAGFVEGELLEVRAPSSLDGAPAGDDEGTVTVAVARFESRATRDAALSHRAGHPAERRHTVVWTWGPLVVLVDGERDFEVVQRIDSVLLAAGAQ